MSETTRLATIKPAAPTDFPAQDWKVSSLAEAQAILAQLRVSDTFTADHTLICTDEVSQEHLEEAIAVRHTAFITEAKRARTIESDEYDYASSTHHFIALLNGAVVGTLRAYLLHEDDRDIKIGRVAVKQELRGKHVGKHLMLLCDEWAFKAGYRSAYLHAELGASEFYAKLGYVRQGEVFMESGAAHILMRMLPPSTGS